MNAQYYASGGQLFLTLPSFTTARTRIAVQLEEPDYVRADGARAHVR